LIRRDEVRPFTDKQIALLKTFARQAVIAIENARLLNELRESLQQQTATADVLKAISRSTFDLQAVLDTLVQSAARLCESEYAFIFRREGVTYHLSASYGFSPDYREWMQRQSIAIGRQTLVGRTAVEARTVHIPDVLADPEYTWTESIKRRDCRTMLGVPLLREGTAIGVIALQRKAVRPFTEKQIELVTTFADQAVIAIENARLLNELRESLQQQIATADVLKAISRSVSELQTVLDTLVETAAHLCNAEMALILRREGEVYRLAANFGFSPEYEAFLKDVSISPGRGTVTARVALEGRVVHVEDITTDPEYALPESSNLGRARTALGVPLLRQNVPIGVIVLARQRVERFTDKQIELVTTFADQAVIAIENARLFEAEQQRTRELTESLEYRTATADILRVISISPTDVQPVFDTIAESAVRLCDGLISGVYRFDGNLIHFVAHHNWTDEGLETVRSVYPRPPSRETQVSTAILDRSVVEVRDFEKDPGVPASSIPLARALGYRSILVVPMLREANPIGAIAVARAAAGPFSVKHIELLKTFADQAVIAIENVRLFEAEQQRTRELSESLQQQTATADILTVISNSLDDTQPVFEAIVQSGLNLFSDATIQVSLADGDKIRLAAVADREPARADAMRRIFPIPLTREYMNGVAILDGRVVDVPDAENAPPELAIGARHFLATGNRAVTIMPMMRGQMPIGALQVVRLMPGPLSDKQREVLRTFANQAVIAIENTRLLHELRESLQQQTATADVLKVISRSTFDLQAVLDTLVESAVRLCQSDVGQIALPKGNNFF
jgi:GAF domain-containing protein